MRCMRCQYGTAELIDVWVSSMAGYHRCTTSACRMCMYKYRCILTGCRVVLGLIEPYG